MCIHPKTENLFQAVQTLLSNWLRPGTSGQRLCWTPTQAKLEKSLVNPSEPSHLVVAVALRYLPRCIAQIWLQVANYRWRSPSSSTFGPVLDVLVVGAFGCVCCMRVCFSFHSIIWQECNFCRHSGGICILLRCWGLVRPAAVSFSLLYCAKIE